MKTTLSLRFHICTYYTILILIVAYVENIFTCDCLLLLQAHEYLLFHIQQSSNQPSMFQNMSDRHVWGAVMTVLLFLTLNFELYFRTAISPSWTLGIYRRHKAKCQGVLETQPAWRWGTHLSLHRRKKRCMEDIMAASWKSQRRQTHMWAGPPSRGTGDLCPSSRRKCGRPVQGTGRRQSLGS